MTDDTILSRRLALGRIGAIALAAFSVPTVLTAATAFAEETDGGEGDGGKDGGGDTGGDGGDDKNGGGDGDTDKNGGDDETDDTPDTTDDSDSDQGSDNGGDDAPAKSISALLRKKRKKVK